MIGIYAITNTINNKAYIGSTVNVERRWAKHIFGLNKNIHPNKKLQNSWNKYGADLFNFIVIEELEDKNNLVEREQYYMDNSKVELLNIRIIAKSNLGLKHSSKTKDSMRQARLTYFKNNPDAKIAIGKVMKEKPNKPWLGKTGPNKNKKMSDLQKSKLSYAKVTKGILQYDKKNNFIKKWNTMTDLQIAGFHNSCILRVCKGERKTRKGFKWAKEISNK